MNRDSLSSVLVIDTHVGEVVQASYVSCYGNNVNTIK